MGIGSRIKTIAKDRSMSLRQVADKAGISYNTLYSITKRDSDRIQLETLQRIAIALGVSITEFLDPSILNAVSSMIHVDPAHLSELMSAPVPEAAELRQFVDVAAFNLEALSRTERAANELNRQIEENRSKINAAFDKLNTSGQEKAVERVEELTEIPKYLRGTYLPATETPPEAPDGPPEAK